VLADSFFDASVFRFMFPDADRRSKVLPRIFKVFAGLYISRGWAYADTEKVEGVMLVRDSRARFGLRSVFGMLGMLRVLRYIPLFSTWKKARQLQPIRQETAAFFQDCPDFVWLEIIAVDPACRGQGVMRRLMTPLLDRIDREGNFCLLETENPANVPIYGHYGFRLVRSGRVLPADIPYFHMAYDPMGIVRG
jgi:GNAT superfamily N-acetyltransferase